MIMWYIIAQYGDLCGLIVLSRLRQSWKGIAASKGLWMNRIMNFA